VLITNKIVTTIRRIKVAHSTTVKSAAFIFSKLFSHIEPVKKIIKTLAMMLQINALDLFMINYFNELFSKLYNIIIKINLSQAFVQLIFFSLAHNKNPLK